MQDGMARGFNKPDVYSGTVVGEEKTKVIGRYGTSAATTEAISALRENMAIQEYMPSAKACVDDDEIAVVRDYFIETGLVPIDKLAVELEISTEALKTRLYKDS
jgi:hypothetical protein